MVARNDTAAMAVLNDALERLGRARLSIDLAADLMTSSRRELDLAGDKVASAAVELRALVQRVQL